MARRRLEAAIQAGKAIDEGKDIQASFTKVDKTVTHTFEEYYDGVFSLQFSYDGEYLVTGYGDSGIEILNTTSGRVVGEVHKHRYGSTPITCIRFNPIDHNIFFAASSEGKVYASNLHDNTSDVVVEEVHNQINCLDFDSQGNQFATGGKDLNVRIYDTKTQELVTTYEGLDQLAASQSVMGHSARIFALRYHPDHNHLFITAGWDNHIKVWDARTCDGVNRTIPGPHICGDSMDIRNNQILTGSWVAHDALQIWDFAEGELLQTVPFNKDGAEYLYCAQFCENNMVLAGGTGTNSIRAINTSTGKMIGEVKMGKAVQAMDSTNGGRKFAVGAMDNKLVMASMS